MNFRPHHWGFFYNLMAMSQFTSILDTTDFASGKFKISQNKHDKDDLEAYIADTQEEILKCLLGDELYLEFGAEIQNPPPTSQRFIDLLDGVVYTYDEKKVDYIGLKRMLELFTYYNYVEDQPIQNTIIGNVKGVSRNSENLSGTGNLVDVEDRYNRAVDLYCEAQIFITRNNPKTVQSTSIVDNLNGTYTVSVPSTLYMENGNTFKLNGKEYQFSNIVVDASFDFNENTGIVFDNISTIAYDVFPTFNGKAKTKSFLGGAI